MKDGSFVQASHAYVDNSLDPAERLNFESVMRQDAKLRARVEVWEAQNEAIRLAFGGAAKAPRLSPSKDWAASEKDAAAAPPRAMRALEPSRLFSLKLRPARAKRLLFRRMSVGACVFSLALLGSTAKPADVRAALMRQADAGLRLARAFADIKLDVASSDPRAVQGWLASRFARMDLRRLGAPGWSLLGARVVPGVGAAAALILFEDAIGGRATLLLQPTDTQSTAPPLSERVGDEILVAGVRRGLAYAVVGPARSGAGALAPAQDPRQPGP